MWNNYEYLLIVLFVLLLLIAIFLSVWLSQKQVKLLHSLSSYEKNPNLDANIIAKVEHLNSQLAPLGLVYNLKFDLIYSIDNGNTIDKIRIIQEQNPELFEEMKDFDAVKRLLD